MPFNNVQELHLYLRLSNWGMFWMCLAYLLSREAQIQRRILGEFVVEIMCLRICKEELSSQLSMLQMVLVVGRGLGTNPFYCKCV